MSRGSLLFASCTIILSLLLPSTVISETSHTDTLDICTSSCGDIYISYPFRLKGDHQSCGDKRFELSCEVNSTTAALYLESGKYYVKSIHYNNFTIRVVESGVQKKKDYCSTPLHSITKYNSAYPYTFPSYEIPYLEEHVPMILVTCATPMNSTLFIETVSCLNITTTYSSKYSYFMVGFVTSFDLGRSCKISQMLLASPSTNSNMVSCEGICDEIVNGFELSWFTYGCGKCKTGEMCELPFYNINNRFNLNTIECNLRPWIFGKSMLLLDLLISLILFHVLKQNGIHT